MADNSLRSIRVGQRISAAWVKPASAPARSPWWEQPTRSKSTRTAQS